MVNGSGIVGRIRSLMSAFWALPAGCTVAATVLALLLTGLDGVIGQEELPFLFPSGPDGARALLSAVASSMIAFTGLVFSITIVVLQLTSSQFSPRVLRTFLDDRGNQLALGVFVATFVYAFVVMRSVRSVDEGEPFIPRVAVTVAFLFMLASVGIFIYYIHHIANAIRAATIVDGIANETRQTLDRCYPAEGRDEPAPAATAGSVRVVGAPGPGVLTAVDVKALVRRARAAHCTITVRSPVGTFLRTGMGLADVRPAGADLDDGTVLAALDMRRERTLEQDVGFGFRQLVDIAERALSPGVNDPTRALQTVDQLHDLLARLAVRPMPSGRYADEGEPVASRCRCPDGRTTSTSRWTR